MKVTLRQAHKLIDKINGQLAKIDVSVQASVSLWDEVDADTAFAAAQITFRQQLNRKLELAGVRQEVRSSVQAVNGTEVNGLVAARKGLLDQLAIYRAVEGTMAGGVSTAAALKAKLAAERAQPRSAYAGDSVAFCVVDANQQAAFAKQIADLQLRVEAIEDQLTTSNASSSIILSEQVVTVLRREGLVQ